MATTSAADPACCLTDSKSQEVSPVTDKSSALLVDSDIIKIVQRKLRSDNFRVLHWNLDGLGETNGYLGSYYTLSVTVRSGDKLRDLRFFAKTPPPCASPQYEFLIRSNTFNKEIIVYSEVVPTLGRGSGPKWLPDYYLGKSNIILVMEDAGQEGYVTPDKYVAFDEEHCIWAVRALSRLHSRSLILDEKLRRSTGQTMLDLYGHLLEELAFVEHDEGTRGYLSSCITGASALVDLMKGLSDRERAVLKDRLCGMINNLPKLLLSSTKHRNVMCHRDVWANNIMFKRDSTGKPIGCYLIDFQFLRYSPPALDFMFCIYLTTDRATRHRCFELLVDAYRDTMRQELAAEGLDVEECIPLSEFVECCEEKRHIAMAFAVANLQVMLLTKEAVEQYFVESTDELEYVLYGDRRSDLVLNQCRSVKAYQTRIVEVIEEFKDHLPDNPSNC